MRTYASDFRLLDELCSEDVVAADNKCKAAACFLNRFVLLIRLIGA